MHINFSPHCDSIMKLLK